MSTYRPYSIAGKTFELPEPEGTRTERLRRIASQRNLNVVYRRKCDATGEDFIWFYPPETLFPVYKYDYFHSDRWNAMDYGRDIDFTRPFFDQIRELFNIVPHVGQSVVALENSEYCNNMTRAKDCYLCFSGTDARSSAYCVNIRQSQDCFDCFTIRECSVCYNCVFAIGCHNLHHSSFTEGCRDSSWLYECQGCSDCFLCAGLSNGRFSILNEPCHDEKEYRKRVAELSRLSDSELQSKLTALSKNIKPITIKNTENSSGAFLDGCNNIHHASLTSGCRDCDNVLWLNNDVSDCVDVVNFGNHMSRNYASMGCGNNASDIYFSALCFDSVSHILYSMMCINNVKDVFGCIGLTGKSYCILNKQYTKEQYEELVPRIIEHMKKYGEWGKAIPFDIVPFCYNESVAQELFPLSREKALGLGFTWRDYVAPFPKVAKSIPGDKLPKNIREVPDDILNWAIICIKSGRPFRIIPMEFAFYRKHNIPVPRIHPDERYRNLWSTVKPLILEGLSN